LLDEAADAHGTANSSSDLPELLKHFVETTTMPAWIE